MHYVYILQLDDGTHYVGYTSDVNERINQHKRRSNVSTSLSDIHQLEFYAAFSDKKKALTFEKYLKSSSGHAFRNKHFL